MWKVFGKWFFKFLTLNLKYFPEITKPFKANSKIDQCQKIAYPKMGYICLWFTSDTLPDTKQNRGIKCDSGNSWCWKWKLWKQWCSTICCDCLSKYLTMSTDFDKKHFIYEFNMIKKRALIFHQTSGLELKVS